MTTPARDSLITSLSRGPAQIYLRSHSLSQTIFVLSEIETCNYNDYYNCNDFEGDE
jgi:hypothetical protein